MEHGVWRSGVMGALLIWAAPAMGQEALVGAASFAYQPEPEIDLVDPEPEAGGGGRGEAPSIAPRGGRFGDEGTRWWSVGGAWAYDFDDANDLNANAALHYFLVEDVEIGLELGGWYFAQEGDDAVGVNLQAVFRWHALHDEEKSWTWYFDTGIGVLASSDLVPDGGTGFNFMPRAGTGVTLRLSEDDTARLMAGVRWHHISNARLAGESRNPSRDGVGVYASVIFPF